jgi:hypothetical protein
MAVLPVDPATFDQGMHHRVDLATLTLQAAPRPRRELQDYARPE